MLKNIFYGSGLGIIFSCILSYILISHPKLYVLLTQESQNFELLTAIFYIISGLTLFYLIIKHHRTIHPIGIIWIILLGTFFVFVGGEEESWGQWLFQYDVSESVKEVNTQNEINIHNLDIFNGMLHSHVILNLFIFGYGIVLPLLNMWISPIRKISNNFNLLISSIALSGWFAISLIYEKFAWTIANISFENWRHAETMEFMFSVGFLILSITSIKQYSLQMRHNTINKL